MDFSCEIKMIANLVRHCAYCQPLSGCILSNLKGKNQQEIINSLSALPDSGIRRIIAFHEGCPYREKIAI